MEEGKSIGTGFLKRLSILFLFLVGTCVDIRGQPEGTGTLLAACGP